jgi:ubiquinone/menaquinone biosynthesis C-methylase UbiE
MFMRREKFKIFDETYQEYDEWYESHQAIYRSQIKALKKIIPPGQGLEIGVGTGRSASPLSVQFGLDPSFNMLKLARQRNIKVVQGYGEDLPFKNETFNFVTIVYTIELVDDPLHCLREAVRTLKKRGALILGILDRKSSWGKFYEQKKTQSKYYKFFRFFSPEEILQIFKDIPVEFKETVQTLFHAPPDIQKIEEPRKGYGQGGFVVLKAVKMRHADTFTE